MYGVHLKSQFNSNMTASQTVTGQFGVMAEDATLKTQKLQSILLLQGPRERYALIHNQPIPSLRDEEVLVRTAVIGLNPIDWKSPYV